MLACENPDQLIIQLLEKSYRTFRRVPEVSDMYILFFEESSNAFYQRAIIHDYEFSVEETESILPSFNEFRHVLDSFDITYMTGKKIHHAFSVKVW